MSTLFTWSALAAYYSKIYQRFYSTMGGEKEVVADVESARGVNWLGKAKKEAKKQGKKLPFFVINVPAYKGADTIRKTAETIAQSDYPKDRFKIYVLTEQKELDEKRQAAGSAVDSAKVIIGPKRRPIPTSTAPQAREIAARAVYDGLAKKDPLLARLAADMIRNPRAKSKELALSLGEEKLRDQIAAAIRGEKVDPEVQYYVDSARKTLNNYSKILGLPLPTQEHVEGQLPQLALELATHGEFLKTPLHKKYAKQYDKKQVTKLAGKAKKLLNRNRGRIAAAETQEQLATRYDSTFRTTPEEADAVVKQINESHPGLAENMILPKHKGFKPGAQNIWLQRVKKEIKNPSNTHVVVFDVDSLPCRWFLSSMAHHIVTAKEQNPVFQGYAFTTSNYHMARTPGLMPMELVPLAQSYTFGGKWRGGALKKGMPDIVGGRGYSIPYKLIKRLGGWDPSTLCEDSRLLIGKVGLMDQGTKFVRPIPAFALEQAPTTFRSYARQTERWVQGMDDIGFILEQPLSRMMLGSDLVQRKLPKSRSELRRLKLRKWHIAGSDALRNLEWGMLSAAPFAIPVAAYFDPLPHPYDKIANTLAAAGYMHSWYRAIRGIKTVEPYVPSGLTLRDKIKMGITAVGGPVLAFPATYYQLKYLGAKLARKLRGVEEAPEWITTPKTKYR